MNEQLGYNDMRAYIAEQMKQDARAEVYQEIGANGAVVRQPKNLLQSSTVRRAIYTICILAAGLVGLWSENNLTPMTAGPLIAAAITSVGTIFGRKAVGDLTGGPK